MSKRVLCRRGSRNCAAPRPAIADKCRELQLIAKAPSLRADNDENPAPTKGSESAPGFAGPAAGRHYQEYVTEFRDEIEHLPGAGAHRQT
jgi:hypothetical protein